MALISTGQQRALIRRHYRGEVYLLTITKADGSQIRLTTAATNIERNGVLFEAAGSVEISNIQSLGDLKEANLEIQGPIVAAKFSEEDIYAERFRNARVRIARVDAIYPQHAEGPVRTFEMDRVSRFDSTSFAAELSGFARRLKQRIGGFQSRTCGYTVGDPNTCTFDFTDDTTEVRQYFNLAVATVVNARTSFTAPATLVPEPFGAGDRFWQDGLVTFTGGNNIGTREVHIKTFDAATRTITLQNKTKFPIQVGDTFNIRGGCQRDTDACDLRRNRARYGGEEFIPSANNNAGGF